MNKAMQRLKAAMAAANPLNGIVKMAGIYLPTLNQHLVDLNQPESEGGLLKEEWNSIIYTLCDHDESVLISLTPISTNAEGEVIMHRPLSTMSVEDLLKQITNG